MRTKTSTLRHIVIASVLSAISLGACQSEAPTSPGVKQVPAGPAATVYDEASRTLGVSINGPNKATAPGNLTWRRIVSGGAGNYRYDWWQAYCYNDIEYCSPLYLMQSGPDTSFTVYYPSNIGKMEIALHVFDDQEVPFAGSASKDVVNMVVQTPYTNPNYTCDYGQGYYPVSDWPAPNPDDTRYYRRNGCTGAREYDPNTP